MLKIGKSSQTYVVVYLQRLDQEKEREHWSLEMNNFSERAFDGAITLI